MVLVSALLAGLCSMGAGSCHGGNVGTHVCLQCHNGREAPDQSAFASSKHGFMECETCHGPGYAHVRNGGQGGLLIGNPANLPFAETYGLCEECHEETTAEYKLSVHAAGGWATCHDCHDVHRPVDASPEKADNRVCLQCHAFTGFGDDAAVEAHTHHPVAPAATGASRCTSCHLPPLERTGQADGPHDHTLMGIPPARSAAQARDDEPVLPNSCSGIAGCHDGSVPSAPVFDVDDPELNDGLQILYDEWFGD